MVLTRKMEEGDKTPTLYNFFGDLYNFNDLSRNVYSGINEYLSTIRRGNKYEKQFREAVTNLMSGIKDGTVTFEDGRYNDSLGRYRNAEDKDEDVYGWAANYIYNNMQNIPKYNKQTTSKKYDNTVLGKELSNIIFGSENGDLSYFWDLDRPDPETNISGVEERLKVLNEAISLINPDVLLKDYSLEDRNRVKALLQLVTNAISNRRLDPGELLTLGKTFGGINWNNWLRTDFNRTSQELQELQEEEGLSKNKFFEYVSSTHPLYQGNLESVTLNNTAQSDELEQLAQRLSKYDNRTLQLIDIDKLDNDSKEVTLDFLISRNLLPLSDGIYIIPNSLKNETVLTYNPKTQLLSRKRTHELSYYRKLWINDYTLQYGSPTDLLSQYFTEFKKNGGILKAENGTQLWYSGLSSVGDFDPAKYTYSYDTSRLVNADMSDDNWDPWVSNVSGVGTGRYLPTAGNTREYTRSIEETPYYLLFRKDLLNPNGTFTEVGLEWANQTDKLLPKGSPATFFDENGKLRTSWTVTNRDVYGRKPQTFTNLADYVNYVNYDLILGGRHNTFLNTGKRYFYKDKDGVEHWVDPNEISNYEVSINPVRSLWNDDKTIYWNDYELTGLKPGLDNSKKETEEPEGSYLFPTENEKKQSSINWENVLGQTAIGLIGPSRLIHSIRTNNKVARTLDRSLNPVLKDTYERYSPITGAFSEMLFRNRQAADLRRLTSRPFTSDASLQLAGQLEADRQARDLEYLGFLADDKEIKRTQEAALARQEDNMARRSDVANFNRASINLTNREKAQLEATRLKRNWQSIDNYLQEVETNLKNRFEERRNLELKFELLAASNRYKDALALLDKKFKQGKPDATVDDMLSNSTYIDAVLRLRRRLDYENEGILRNNGFYRRWYHYRPESYLSVITQAKFAKKGGVLRPSILHLINEVIKNENHT